MKTVLFRFPTIREVAEASRYYNQVRTRLEKDGVPSKNGIMFHLNRHDIYTYAMENEITRLESLSKIKYKKPYGDMEETEVQKTIDSEVTEIIAGERVVNLSEYLLNKPEQKQPDADTKKYYELSNLRDESLKYTVEYLSERERTMRLAQLCSYNWDNDERVWKDWDMFCGEKNRSFQLLITNLCSSFLNGIPQSKLRKIARHPIWRSKWISATKSGSQLFEGTVASWDNNKTFLCYWSNFYDNINSAYEPPEDFVIEDDELLDGWLEKRAREAKSGSTSTGADKEGSIAFFRNRVNPVAKQKG